MRAAEQDKQRNEQGKSAVAKLAMLDEVMAVLRKSAKTLSSRWKIS